MKTYLITGGAGFIGSNFIRYILNKYKEIMVINFDKLTYAGNLSNLKDIESYNGYKFIRGDICNKEDVINIFRTYDVDYVINFAAESHVDRSINGPDVFTITNMLGTQTLLDVCRSFWHDEKEFRAGKKYIQISTDEVYGSLSDTGYFTEETPINPRSPYSASKAAADLMVQAYYHTYRLPMNITRCSNNYGPYQFPEKLIPLIINNCLNNKPIPVYGDGRNVRDWIYVEDHCRAIDVVVKDGLLGEVYNIGGNCEKMNIDTVKTIISTLQLWLEDTDIRKIHINDSLIRFVKDRMGHDKRYAIDCSKIAKELGWQPQKTFKEGIVETVKWYLNNERWLISINSGQYQKYYEEMYGSI